MRRLLPICLVSLALTLGQTSPSVASKARYPSRPALVVGVGDSIASGHGLDERDYLGGDGCWRDLDEAYPKLVFDVLHDDARAETFRLVACSGATVGDLSTDPVADGMSQVDWVIRHNPGFVVMTVGANDVDFDRPEDLIRGGVLDSVAFDPRLRAFATDLEAVLHRLLEETDAEIAITTLYDPSADRPQGIDGCRTACFKEVVGHAVDRLNIALVDVVDAVDDARIRVIDIEPLFVGHGAPNGLGPDSARAGRGWLGGLLGPLTGGVQPYCAKGDTRGEPWVSVVDCVHPNRSGTAAIAVAVADAL